MARRRDNSRNFDIGAKSPHVLDLSRPERATKAVRKTEKSRKKATRPKKPLTGDKLLLREDVLKELEAIEGYDAELASALNIPSQPEVHDLFPEASQIDDEFLDKELALFLQHGEANRAGSVIKRRGNILNFALVSGILTVLLFGAFFVQKSIIAKNDNTQKIVTQNKDSQRPQKSSQLSFALEAIKSFSFSGIPDLGNKIPSILNAVGIAKDFYGIAPALLGHDEPKRYILVFQNSSELRPTGGFIGTYAMAEISGGELQDVFVDGIYNIDGQLTVNVVPPKPLQHIATAWSTHDANWFLDFPTSAEKIIWFYAKTGGGKLDGAITLNVEVVEKLLALTGPVILPEYNLVVGEENFRNEIQYQVEVAYDKELNRPKKILADFAPLFFEKLSDVLQSASSELTAVLVESLEEKNIMFYSKDREVQEFFEEQGWSGNVKCQMSNVKCSQEDYLAVVHSNIGGHKTSKYMEDEIAHNVEIQEDGSLIDTLTLKRTHNGGDTKYWWYNRENIDYVKIYVPEGAEILSYEGGVRREPEASVDYETLDFIEDSDVAVIEGGMSAYGPIDIFTETGKTVFGTWLVTSPKKTTEFKISYKLPLGVKFINEIAKYNLYLQKQPGTRAQTNLAISYPHSWGVVWDNIEKSFVLDKDRVIGYIFER